MEEKKNRLLLKRSMKLERYLNFERGIEDRVRGTVFKIRTRIVHSMEQIIINDQH